MKPYWDTELWKRFRKLIKKRSAFILLTILIIVVAALVISDRKKPVVYENCDQIKFYTGRSYIKEGDSLYQHRLDVPYNGIACE